MTASRVSLADGAVDSLDLTGLAGVSVEAASGQLAVHRASACTDTPGVVEILSPDGEPVARLDVNADADGLPFHVAATTWNGPQELVIAANQMDGTEITTSFVLRYSVNGASTEFIDQLLPSEPEAQVLDLASSGNDVVALIATTDNTYIASVEAATSELIPILDTALDARSVAFSSDNQHAVVVNPRATAVIDLAEPSQIDELDGVIAADWSRL